MENLIEQLKNMERKHDFLVCIDSDGTVFDNMELKHKECFCPAFVNVWELQAVSKYARQVWEYVNLYSRSRGFNRFVALITALDLLRDREEVRQRNVEIPNPESLRKYIADGGTTNNVAITAWCQEHPEDADMARALRWSLEINENVARIVRGAMPFPLVKETLAAIREFADIVVVSDTPNVALTKEWKEHGIDQYATVICGQEFGSKKLCIATAVETGGYDKNHVLMIGDAVRDHQAAIAEGVLYYPIVPSQETESWKMLLEEAADRFHTGSYHGAYMDGLLAGFYKVLRDEPEW